MNVEWVIVLVNAIAAVSNQKSFCFLFILAGWIQIEMDSQMNNWHQSLYSWKNQ